MMLGIRYAEVHFRIDEVTRRRNSHPDVWIDRWRGLGPYVGYYATLADAQVDNRIILDVWDRKSFREAYRHARVWGYDGIGARALRSAGGAA
ncbi:hypothetical protein [Phenylobacterium sp.]|uniref:hypothetical protein n=1 Tax=Phenylobacterium sp. TaxID=1871053 RepID=UPI00198C158C|nr:hypothetical protein [Phenylobacterium sp.]MBC7168707.1 hypothetical protein [Phenylobacterium sp.]